MYDKCDPYVFYWKIRPYLAGWENMAEAGLPHGLVYEGVDDTAEPFSEEKIYRRYAGGSAAQSSLIAALDIAFGVEHHKTGSRPSHNEEKAPAKGNKFLMSMRKYMPKQHRQFLEDLEVAANIRPYMLQLFENYKNGDISPLEMSIVDSYNNCLDQLKLFRDKHVQIVTRYIISQARSKSPREPQKPSATDMDKQVEGPPAVKEELPHLLGLARPLASDAKVVRGTGGTNIMPFLKQSRDETRDMQINMGPSQIHKKDSIKSWIDWALRR
jgi:indoleamine 2,3-dioxygenase